MPYDDGMRPATSVSKQSLGMPLLAYPRIRAVAGSVMPLSPFSSSYVVCRGRRHKTIVCPTRRQLVMAFLLAAFTVATAMAQKAPAPSDPAKGFDPSASAENTNAGGTTPVAPARSVKLNPAAKVVLLPQHGNVHGGVDRGMHSVGIIFGARIYGGNITTAIELFYYLPSNDDNYYRDGDYRASTGRIGSDNGDDLGGYYCPAGYAGIGLQGASGLGVDRIGLICGKIGDLSRTVPIPVLGGKGGNPFRDICDKTYSLGLLTGVRVRSGLWMDSIQGLCQARE